MERFRERTSGSTSSAADGQVRRLSPPGGIVQTRSDTTARAWVNTVLAIVALVVPSPLMLLIAVVVKLTSRGSALYTQTRVGLDRRQPGVGDDNHRRALDLGGKPFTIYKFRTMHLDAERKTGAVWASKGDSRITPVGRFLRQYRLDELPQLFNVLKGEMNIVGPRPERPTIFAELTQNIAEYPLRQRAKPGITGLAHGRNNITTSAWTTCGRRSRIDPEYIRQQGLLEDFKIMLKTIPVVLLRRGGW